MDPRHLGPDTRQLSWCVYCGNSIETKDHLPPKVFLDEPFPPNLPDVPSCYECNNKFSKDEEYVACLVECAVVGSANLEDITRDKIRQILKRKPALSKRLSEARVAKGGEVSFSVEKDRLRDVCLKLARGHTAYDMNDPRREEPVSIRIIPLTAMLDKDRAMFETPLRFAVLPEVGSRLIHRVVTENPGSSYWDVIQPGRYRYLACITERGVVIRFVLNECLACEVTWD